MGDNNKEKPCRNALLSPVVAVITSAGRLAMVGPTGMRAGLAAAVTGGTLSLLPTEPGRGGQVADGRAGLAMRVGAIAANPPPRGAVRAAPAVRVSDSDAKSDVDSEQADGK